MILRIRIHDFPFKKCTLLFFRWECTLFCLFIYFLGMLRFQLAYTFSFHSFAFILFLQFCHHSEIQDCASAPLWSSKFHSLKGLIVFRKEINLFRLKNENRCQTVCKVAFWILRFQWYLMQLICQDLISWIQINKESNYIRLLSQKFILD